MTYRDERRINDAKVLVGDAHVDEREEPEKEARADDDEQVLPLDAAYADAERSPKCDQSPSLTRVGTHFGAHVKDGFVLHSRRSVHNRHRKARIRGGIAPCSRVPQNTR